MSRETEQKRGPGTLSAAETQRLRALDKERLWHPFTQMQAWCAPEHDPLVITRGEGVWLYDSEGNSYIDGNSSIWTNIHGHNHPKLNAALEAQVKELAHCSALGFTNPPAIELADRLVKLFPGEKLSRVFYSDDGSTALECACKMAVQYWQLKGASERTKFLSFEGAYHGDTAGAASLGGIGTFHKRFEKFGFEVEHIQTLGDLDRIDPRQFAGVTIEPLIQGAAGMRLWPKGMLQGLNQWCEETGVLLILDEVMTGFGRSGTMFACEQEGVVPDLIGLAKGLTGGYMPLAATLATEEIFEAFLGEIEEQKTFYYGHSYCGNPLGCAVALASLDVFEEENVLAELKPKIGLMQQLLHGLQASSPWVADIRQCGFMAGIEAAQPDGTPYPWGRLTGAKVCLEARKHGLLTRPVLDTIVLMPPLSISEGELQRSVDAIQQAVAEVGKLG